MIYYKILEWDSNFFGFKVAKILPNFLDVKTLDNTLKIMKSENVSLVYWATNDINPETKNFIRSLGGNLVDKKVTFSMEIVKGMNIEDNPDNSIEEYKLSVPNEELETLSLESGKYSRFNLDKKIGKSKYEELYKLWIKNSILKEFADIVYVRRNDKDKVVGMITLLYKNQTASIGIFAVDSLARGKGIGKELIAQSILWSIQKGCTNLQVVTQLNNLNAYDFYLKCGFRLQKIEDFYHFWM